MISLAESPTGLVHLIRVQPSGRARTRCGRDADFETWIRIDSLDRQMYGKSISSKEKLIEMPTCDRCFKP